MQFLPSPAEVARHGRRIYQQRDRRRQPLWSRPWFWFTGAFSLAIVFWMTLAELWLVYAMLWGALWCALWGFRWVGAMVMVGPRGAIESHREDRRHARRVVAARGGGA